MLSGVWSGFGSQGSYNFHGEGKNTHLHDHLENTKTNVKNVTKPSITFTMPAKEGWGFLCQHPLRGQGWKPCSLTKASMYSCVGCLLFKEHQPTSSLFSVLQAIHLPWDCTLQEERVFFWVLPRSPVGGGHTGTDHVCDTTSRSLCTSRCLDLRRTSFGSEQLS